MATLSLSQRRTDYVHATTPYIEDTTKNNESLKVEIEVEKEANKTIISQAKEEALAIEKAEEEIAKEKATEEKLELAKQMKQFTKRKP